MAARRTVTIAIPLLSFLVARLQKGRTVLPTPLEETIVLPDGGESPVCCLGSGQIVSVSPNETRSARSVCSSYGLNISWYNNRCVAVVSASQILAGSRNQRRRSRLRVTVHLSFHHSGPYTRERAYRVIIVLQANTLPGSGCIRGCLGACYPRSGDSPLGDSQSYSPFTDSFQHVSQGT